MDVVVTYHYGAGAFAEAAAVHGADKFTAFDYYSSGIGNVNGIEGVNFAGSVDGVILTALDGADKVFAFNAHATLDAFDLAVLENGCGTEYTHGVSPVAGAVMT